MYENLRTVLKSLDKTLTANSIALHFITAEQRYVLLKLGNVYFAEPCVTVFYYAQNGHFKWVWFKSVL